MILQRCFEKYGVPKGFMGASLYNFEPTRMKYTPKLTLLLSCTSSQRVLTDGKDEEHLSKGVYDTYTNTSLRYMFPPEALSLS